MDRADLQEIIDWPTVLKQDRCAGGHRAVMSNIFSETDAKVIAWYQDDVYEGELAIAYQFYKDGTICLITDYFGSCSGCDAWEGADNEEAESQIRTLVANSRVFKCIRASLDFLNNDIDNKPENFGLRVATNLIDTLKNIDDITFAEPEGRKISL